MGILRMSGSSSAGSLSRLSHAAMEWEQPDTLLEEGVPPAQVITPHQTHLIVRHVSEPDACTTPQFQFCLDREFVQKEIGWARKYKKKIVVVFEKDARKVGFFDYAKAREKYSGGQWDDILSVSGLEYQRDKEYAEGMVKKILGKLDGVPVRPIHTRLLGVEN
jgi:hypothetical protein